MNIFEENTTMLGDIDSDMEYPLVNPMTGLAEALIEHQQSYTALIEAMHRVDATELRMRREGMVDESTIAALQEGAAGKVWERVVAWFKWLRDKIVGAATAFAAAVKKFFSYRNPILAKIHAYMNNAENKKLVAAHKLPSWIVFKHSPCTSSPEDAIKIKDFSSYDELKKLVDKKDSELVSHFFGVKSDKSVHDAVADAVTKYFTGGKTVDEITQKDYPITKVKDWNYAFDTVLKKAESEAAINAKVTKKVTAMHNKVDRYRNERRAAELALKTGDDISGVVKVANVYCTGYLAAFNTYNALAIKDIKQYVAAQNAIATICSEHDKMSDEQKAKVKAMVDKAKADRERELMAGEESAIFNLSPMAQLAFESAGIEIDGFMESYMLEADENKDGGDAGSDETKSDDNAGEEKKDDKKGPKESLGSRIANSKVGKGVAKGWKWIVDQLTKLGGIIQGAINSLIKFITDDTRFMKKYESQLKQAGASLNDIAIVKYEAENYNPNFRFNIAHYADAAALEKEISILKDVKMAKKDTTIGAEGGIVRLMDSFKENGDMISTLKRDLATVNQNLKFAKKKAADAGKNGEVHEGQQQKVVAYYNAAQALCKLNISIAVNNHKAKKAAIIKAIAAVKNKGGKPKDVAKDEGKPDETSNNEATIISEAQVQLMIEAANDEIDTTIAKAITTGAAQGINDVNLASTDVLGSGVSTDPNALDYDKTDCYSATTDMSDVQAAGTIGGDYDSDTDRTIARGNPTKAATESAIDRAFRVAFEAA